MAKDREPPTLADYVVTALSPALIMGLVGSLAFFLLEVGYAGKYGGRLWWTTFWFVFGAVLVSRIAITIDPTRAWLYRLALSGAVFLSLLRFMDFAGRAGQQFAVLTYLGLIVVVLWSANKLTWDCTYVDEKEEDAGRGLMTEVGRHLASVGPHSGDDDGPADGPDPQSKRKPLGLWVVYFSLAALPLFGLGQTLIPTGDTGRRQYVFWLMIVYVGCGLGLLLTTSFLGIRRYLRQRKQQMPPAMTTVWLGAGAALIVAFLLLGALLPRPHAEYPLIALTPVGSQDVTASRYAPSSDDAGQGEGRPGSRGKENTPDANDGRGGGQGQAGGKADGNSGQPEGEGKDGEGSGQSKDGKSSSKQGKNGGKGNRDSKAGQGGSGQDQSKAGTDGKSNTGRQSEDRSGTTPQSPDLTPPSALSNLANILKWVVLVILGLAVAAFVIWFVLKNLSAAHQWARDLLAALAAFWQSLFGGGRQDREAVAEEAVVAAEVIRRPRPFADFRNPFADGGAAGRSPEELVRYSFAALQAWAADRGGPRRDDETPLEFAARLAGETPAVEAEVRQLVGLYARLAYGRRRLPESSRAAVEQFWRRLEAAREQPLSA
jgi:hypothetical protein